MYFDLTNDAQRQQFREHVERLLKKGSVVRLTDEQPRTLEQNSFFQVLVGLFACRTGCQPKEVKAIIKTLVCPDIFIRGTRLRSTADLTSTEMQTVISRFQFYASTVAGIELPEADKYRAVIEGIRQVEKARDFIPQPSIKWKPK